MSALIDTQIYRQRLETESNGGQESNKGDSPGMQTENGLLQYENGAMNLLDDGPLHNRLTSSDQFATQRIGQDFEAICTDASNASIFVASSNIVGHPTEGFIHKYTSLSEVPHKSWSGVDVKQSCCKELLVAGNNVIAGFDSGALLICDQNLSQHVVFSAHDAYFSDLIVDRSSARTLMTTSVDCCVRQWDLANLYLKRAFVYPHPGPVTGMDFEFNSETKLVSCGGDRMILTWDLRLAKPTSKYAALRGFPTCIRWSASSSHMFYVGTSDGVLISFDSRKPAKDLGALRLGRSGVYRLKALPEGNRLVYCLHNGEFGAVKEEPLENCYRSNCSKQVVRDFLAYNGDLYTVGHGSQEVVKHTF